MLTATAPARTKPHLARATVTIAAPRSGALGAGISFRVTSVFAGASNGAEHLTVFVSPPGVSCPKGVRPPGGADSLLSAEPADRVLIAHVISDPLRRRGIWTICGYLTHGPSVTASARAQVRIA